MFVKRKRRKKVPPYRRRKYLCTNGEWHFCRKLREAVGNRFEVMMQVRVGSLLECRAEDWERLGRRVSQKSFDFVLVRRGTSFAAAVIELDDKTHLLPARRARDKFLDDACRRAGLPLIRFRAAGRYDLQEIRESIRAALPDSYCKVGPGPARARPGNSRPPGWVWLIRPSRRNS